MRIPRIYSPVPLSGLAEVELDESASRHLVKALRFDAGREIILFDGFGGEYRATLTEAGKRARARLDEFAEGDRQSPLAIELAIGISRGERFDWVVQKATELGVHSIRPLFTERCEVRLKGDRLAKKVQHWQKIAISACEQCARNLVPAIEQPQSLREYLQSGTAGETGRVSLVLHHRTAQTLAEIQQVRGAPASATLLVGPEGGLSAEEIGSAESAGFQALALGPRVLRTETAPVAALSVLQFFWGDF
ncbi:16S rRNA (uracil(1498)-N(3))-methyltransferase [Biformimicrobium ophioploci]|uniref:Ribosomal RNA small subunit methyltransferase E n=1 Tax=Biformimicrobium ophioploci TaxID=3036711 RepID=A0ABQ6M0G1_9GAMM|nr:16S rRNA (uracil(1498)-N(3))-methyltransferase [Microbulbifer sp. NKW57]GMG87777.1 16S rRNA (uracil(1498)-N(3))-methyltransferase [Microbulbifer sp. NKW57]